MTLGVRGMSNNKPLSKMPHYKMVVAYSCWEFPLAGGPCALAKGVGGCLSNNIDSVSL
jgi:hypothetical protein